MGNIIREYKVTPEYIEYDGSLYKLVEPGLTHVEDICIHMKKDYSNLFSNIVPPKGGNVAQKD